MICPHCRHDKFADHCSSCGLSELEALLEGAEIQGKNGNITQQMEFLNKYIRLSPDNLEVAQKKALLQFVLFNREPDDSKWESVDTELLAVLQRDWFWMRGHECRLQLHQFSGTMDKLEAFYRGHLEMSEPAIKEIDEKALQIIRLTREFANLSPKVDNSLTGSEWSSERKRSIGIAGLIGICAILFCISSPSAVGKENFPWVVGGELLLIYCTVVIIWLHRHRNKGKVKK